MFNRSILLPRSLGASLRHRPSKLYSRLSLPASATASRAFTTSRPTPFTVTTPQFKESKTTMAAEVSNTNFTLGSLFNVKDKVALITGGGSGIGLMATQALATNGSKVYITGRTSEKLERVAELYGGKAVKGEIIPLTSDVTDKASIQKLVQEISSRESGRLDILINNAGISSSTQNTEHDNAADLSKALFDESSSPEEWESVYRTNVVHPYLVTSAFLPLLQKSSEQAHGWSSTVINITSISGIVKTSQHHFAYNASKGAAIHLTKMLAHEISSSGLRIRVNNIAPGVFPSEMTAGESDEKQKSALEKEKYEGKIPAGRPGKDEDMASTVLFAATNQYLNGQTLVVDGGYVLAAGTV